ncbi:alpha-amylase family protein [Sphingomonas crusticola]|uniref:alpha-amylase family protein n=1 Tax=Sphingomonas crusticola TaxID=1697973 RepID=UPI000E22B26D|nr:alpha-amylase family protein [Sphingomonas crusticola]
MDANRREFTTWGVTGAASLLGGLLPTAAMAAPIGGSGGGVPWYKTIKRIGQTNFNERDPEFGDVEAWANYWASAKVQAVALSVSGPVAFYPTKVPFFHVSDYLRGRDLFGECLTAAKKRGIRVFGRMSPDIQYTDPKLLAAHPLWFRRDKAGNLQTPAPNIAFTCQFSGQFTEQQPAILRELTALYDIDGVYMNGWPTMQECYCENCRKIGDPRSEAYKTALMDSAAQLTDLYRSIVTARNPNNFYSCNVAGGMEDSGLDQWKLTRKANWYTSDNQARSAVEEPVWQDAQQVKYAHAMMGDRPVAAVTGSYTRSGPTMWRQVADTTFEPTFRMAQTTAAGGIVWYHHLGLEQGFTVDRRWQAPGRDFLSWHAANEPHFHNKRSLANVAIVLPTNTMSHRKEAKGKATDYLQGVYAALVDARIPVDFVHENDLTATRLAPYALLILPNFAMMSDAQADALNAFVKSGGSLLATYQTGLYDAAGAPRADFALGGLFGISKAGEPVGTGASVLGSFAPIHLQSIRRRGPLTEGFDETKWIAGPSWTQPVKPVADAPLTFLDPYPVYPPEAVYPRARPTDRPAVVTRQVGAARLAYLAGDMDATYWRLDNPDLGRQLINTIHWLLDGKAPVSVTGDGLMEVIAWQTGPGYALHMLNYNGPNAFRGHMRKPVPLGAQAVRMTLPDGASVRSAKLLRAGRTVAFQQTGRTIDLTVPAVDAYEVLALEV